MGLKYYLLAGKDIIETDLDTWGHSFDDENYNRRIAFTRVTDSAGTRVEVSTVFLGIDHSFCVGGPPILFETMVFGGLYTDYQTRYHTYDEAVLGHETAVALVASS